MDFKSLRVGYVPHGPDLDLPGDRRRFCHWARRRGVPFEVADPSRAYDLVVATESADLSLWSAYRKGRLAYDMVDASLAIPRTDVKGLLRGPARFVSGRSRRFRLNHWRALEDMCRRADTVICGCEEQERYIRPFNRNVHSVLDFHGMYDALKTDYAAGPILDLVWEGQPHNAVFFGEIRGALRAAASRRAVALHLVTGPRYRPFLRSLATEHVVRRSFEPVIFHEWSEATCPAVITGCDLAVIPIPLDDAFAAGKPENKLLLFWRMGVPAVVSATPAYERVLKKAGLADMACRTESEWVSALETYGGDESKRREAARRGLEYVREECAEEKLLARWDAALVSALG